MRGCGRQQPVGPFLAALTLRRGGPRPPAAGRESSSEGHWFANAPELKGADGGLWEGIVIRGQIAPLLARQERGRGCGWTAGARRAPSLRADVQQLEACAQWGARSLALRGRARARLCGVGTMPLTLGCPLCVGPRRPSAQRHLCNAPPSLQTRASSRTRLGRARPGASKLPGACQGLPSGLGPAARPGPGPHLAGTEEHPGAAVAAASA